MSDDKVVCLQQRRKKIEEDNERKELIRSINNPIVDLLHNTAVALRNDEDLIDIYQDGVVIESRQPTALEKMILIQLGITERAILLLLENYEPDKINWAIAPHKSVEFDRLLARREELENSKGDKDDQ